MENVEHKSAHLSWIRIVCVADCLKVFRDGLCELNASVVGFTVVGVVEGNRKGRRIEACGNELFGFLTVSGRRTCRERRAGARWVRIMASPGSKKLSELGSNKTSTTLSAQVKRNREQGSL